MTKTGLMDSWCEIYDGLLLMTGVTSVRADIGLGGSDLCLVWKMEVGYRFSELFALSLIIEY